MGTELSEDNFGAGLEAFEKPPKSAGRWLKLADGDAVNVNIIGNEIRGPFEKDFNGKTSIRFETEIFNVDEHVVQVWEMSATVADTVHALIAVYTKKGKKAADQIFTLSRVGALKDTKYSMMHDDAISDDQRTARSQAFAEWKKANDEYAEAN